MPVNVNNDSVYIQWQVIRKNSCFLRRQRGIPKTFSRERFNPTSTNSIRFNGLVNKKGVDIQPSDNGKGVVMSIKKKKCAVYPSRLITSVVLDKNARRAVKTIKNSMEGYKPGHSKMCQRRASQIFRSKKPLSKKNKRKQGKTEA